MLSQNDSLKIDFQEFTLDVDEQSIVGNAAQRAGRSTSPTSTGSASRGRTRGASAYNNELRREDRLPRPIDAHRAHARRRGPR